MFVLTKRFYKAFSIFAVTAVLVVPGIGFAETPWGDTVSVTTLDGTMTRDSTGFVNMTKNIAAIEGARPANESDDAKKLDPAHNPVIFEKWDCLTSQELMRFDIDANLRASISNRSACEVFVVLPRPKIGYTVIPYRPIGGYRIASTSTSELEWNAVHDAALYEVFVSTDRSGLEHPIARVAAIAEASSATFTYDIPPVVSGDVSSDDYRPFYWKVRALDNDGKLISESRTDYFHVARTSSASSSALMTLVDAATGRGVDADSIEKYSIIKADELLVGANQEFNTNFTKLYIEGLNLQDNAMYDWDTNDGKIEAYIFIAVTEGTPYVPPVFEGGSSSGCNAGASMAPFGAIIFIPLFLAYGMTLGRK